MKVLCSTSLVIFIAIYFIIVFIIIIIILIIIMLLLFCYAIQFKVTNKPLRAR